MAKAYDLRYIIGLAHTNTNNTDLSLYMQHMSININLVYVSIRKHVALYYSHNIQKLKFNSRDKQTIIPIHHHFL